MNESELRDRFTEYTGRIAPEKLTIVTDTTEFMEIERDQIIRLDERFFAVQGNAYEGRFGIDDQPKFWVKRTVDLADGSRKIIKLIFHEEMITSLGPLKYKCVRSGEKEALILNLTRGDHRFMQGISLFDEKQNTVRVIDYIYGMNLFNYLTSMKGISHEEYFHEHFPGLFTRLISSIEAIAILHKHNICHGDIRNDHIFLEKDTVQFRWIDFDINQVSLDFDVWSLGNLIFLVIAKDDITCRWVEQGDFGNCDALGISPGDTLAFFPHRLANLKKLFPYIPENLHQILMKYSSRALDNMTHYKTTFNLLDDLKRCCHDNNFDNCPMITVDPLNM